jgi:hypothetical protein
LEPQGFVDRYFTNDDRPVSSIPWDDEIRSAEIFINHGIQISLADSKLGLCNWIHEKVTYTYGYGDPRAIRLAHLAARLVDSPKQGLILKKEKWKRFETISPLDKPAYWSVENERNTEYKRHLMDILVLHTLPDCRTHILKKFTGALGDKKQIPPDSDVMAFYDKIFELRPDIIEAIQPQLKSLKREWGVFWKVENKSKSPVGNRTPEQRKQDKLV